jgi:hypothetical protein
MHVYTLHVGLPIGKVNTTITCEVAHNGALLKPLALQPRTQLHCEMYRPGRWLGCDRAARQRGQRQTISLQKSSCHACVCMISWGKAQCVSHGSVEYTGHGRWRAHERNGSVHAQPFPNVFLPEGSDVLTRWLSGYSTIQRRRGYKIIY